MSETTKTHNVAGLTTKLRIAGSIDMAPVTDGLARVMMSGARYPGFWSAEIIPPAAIRGEWTLVERFSSVEQASAWMNSDTRKQLLEELRSVAPGRILSVEDLVDDHGLTGTAATAIVTNVKPGMEDKYWYWEEKIQSAQARFPGYRGTYIQPPPPDKPGQWTTLLRFDTPETLESWLASAQRKSLLLEANDLVNTIDFQDMSSSFPGWFPVDKSGQRPPIWKTASLVLIGIFPLLIGSKLLLASLLAGVNSTVTIALSTLISVCAVSWICMPALVRVFKWWLLPEPTDRGKTNRTGAAIVLGVFIIEIALCWSL